MKKSALVTSRLSGPCRLGFSAFAGHIGLFMLPLILAGIEVEAAPAVDEPQGLRSNLGGTLWHYRHDPELIREFHAFLKQRGLGPTDLLSAQDLEPPKTMVRMVIEPEQLSNLPEGAWSVQQWPGASGGGGLGASEGGRHMYVPLRVVPGQAGTYRLWVRHYTFSDSAGLIGIRIYPTGQEESLPLLDVLANEWQVQEEGWRWSSYLVDLPAEPVELQIVHANPEHQAPGRRSERRLDCIYLTTECWREAPSLEELALVHKSGKLQSWSVYEPYTADQTARPAMEFRQAREKTVRIQEVAFGNTEADKQSWAWWMARPADWEMRDRYPKLFEASYTFWRQKVEELAKTVHEKSKDVGRKRSDPAPGYRHLSRQVIFDDQWNLIGNPVMIAQEVGQIFASYPDKGGKDQVYHWLEAEEFERFDPGWQQADRSGNSKSCLRPANDQMQVTASQRLKVDRRGRYAVWLRTGILADSYSPLRVQLLVNGVRQVSSGLFKPGYPSDGGSDWSWHKLGVVHLEKKQELQVQLSSVAKSEMLARAKPSGAAPAQADPRFFYRWIEAEDLETIEYNWAVRTRSGNSGDRCLGMGVNPTGSAGYAAEEIRVDQTGNYYLWVRKGFDLGKYAPIRVVMLSPEFGPPERRTSPRQWHERAVASLPQYADWNRRQSASVEPPPEIAQGTMARLDMDRNDYEPDGPGQWTWQRVGPLKVKKAGNVRVEFHRRHYPYVYESRRLMREVLDELGPFYFDCLVLTNNADYRPRGIYQPRGPRILYLRPAVDCLVVTDDLRYQPRLATRPKLNLPAYRRRAESLGAKSNDWYLLWRDDPYGEWTWNDWPKTVVADSGADRITLTLPRDSVWASSLRVRSLRDDPIRLQVNIAPLQATDGGIVGNKIKWRVVAGIAPTWDAVPLLRRPYLTLPPYRTSAIWLTFDVKGLGPGIYRSEIILTADGLPARRVPVRIEVADLSIMPKKPILFCGWHEPYRGLVYKQDFKDHGVNVLIGSMSRAERRRWGYRMVKYNRPEGGPNRRHMLLEQHHSLLERMRADQVGFDECIWRIGDEGSGMGFLYPGKLAKEIDPRIPVCYNPGPTPGLAAFKELDPYTSIWWPYVKHFNYPERVAIFSVKPYLWYEVYSGSELSTSLPSRVYAQIHSVPGRPGNCIGTGLYSVKAIRRDPWDTAYQQMPQDEGVFMYPSRHGPIPSRAWEAIRDAIQHANLATMLKEKAAELELSDPYANLIVGGDIADLTVTLEELN